MFSKHRIFRTTIAVLVLAVQCIAASARPPALEAFRLGEVAVDVPGNAMIGSVRSGLLCTPTGSLFWHQVAMPTEKAIKDRIGIALRAAGRTVSGDAPTTLSLTIDAASIKVCRAWMGVGNAPKGKGAITLTWHRLGPAGAIADTKMVQDLVFAGRDPREDPTVILDAIAAAASLYTQQLTATGKPSKESPY